MAGMVAGAILQNEESGDTKIVTRRLSIRSGIVQVREICDGSYLTGLKTTRISPGRMRPSS